jgi:beta-glucosidase
MSNLVITAGTFVKATVTASNTGKWDAEEIVQLYVSKDDRGETDPMLSLRGFRRIFIPVGKSATVEFDLPSMAFESVNANGEYALLPGSYTVIAADAAPVPASLEKGASSPVSVKINVE